MIDQSRLNKKNKEISSEIQIHNLLFLNYII